VGKSFRSTSHSAKSSVQLYINSQAYSGYTIQNTLATHLALIRKNAFKLRSKSMSRH